MLQVGLTGGIGAGKSTVAARLAGYGAVLVDSDVIAREVVAAGSAGLAEIVEAFGPRVLAADGSLDRPALAGIVFADDAARARLNAIVHPRVRARSAELVRQAAPDAVLVHDIPLLVENGLAPVFQLVLVVHASVDTRVRRLVDRGLPEHDAVARIAAQAGEEQRRAVADVWLDNEGAYGDLHAALDELWSQRLVPFEENLRLRRPVRWQPVLAGPDPHWPAQALRLLARVELAAGAAGVRADHIGSTAVPGLLAKDVLDLQLTVESLAVADELVDALAGAGFPRLEGIGSDNPKASDPDPRHWGKRLHQSADPGRPANLHIRVAGSPGQRYALLIRDWLRADAAARVEYEQLKRQAADGNPGDPVGYTEAKEPWFDHVLPRAQEWAARTGWVGPG